MILEFQDRIQKHGCDFGIPKSRSAFLNKLWNSKITSQDLPPRTPPRPKEGSRKKSEEERKREDRRSKSQSQFECV